MLNMTLLGDKSNTGKYKRIWELLQPRCSILHLVLLNCVRFPRLDQVTPEMTSGSELGSDMDKRKVVLKLIPKRPHDGFVGVRGELKNGTGTYN